MYDYDAQQTREYERQRTVDYVVNEIDRMLLDESDGSVAVTNRLPVEIADLLFRIATVSIATPDNQFVSTNSMLSHKARALVFSVVDNFKEDSRIVRDALLMRVAERFFLKAIVPFDAALTHWDIENPAQSQ